MQSEAVGLHGYGGSVTKAAKVVGSSKIELAQCGTKNG